MALMVDASPPSCFRPPPDPPPYDFPLLEALSPISPPEPPDPPDSVYLLAPLRILVTSAKPSVQDFTQTLVLKLPCPTMATKLSDDGAPLVSYGDTSFVYGCLFPVVCRSSHCWCVDWSYLRFCLDLPFPLTSTVLQVHLCSLSPYLCYVEWVGMQIVWMTLDMWPLVLVDDVLMDKVSFGFTFVPFSGIYVALVRSLTAVCSLIVVFSRTFGAVILFFSFWWQLEEKHNGLFHTMNIVLTGIDLPDVSCLEQFLFPIFPPVWSELEAQTLLVLQKSSSQLMLFSAFCAVVVILRIALDAIIQEAYKIIMPCLWFLVVNCINSILCFISLLLLLLALGGFVVSSSNGV